VKQQIDSFDEFITNTIGELIEDAGEIIAIPGKIYCLNFSIIFFLYHREAVCDWRCTGIR